MREKWDDIINNPTKFALSSIVSAFTIFMDKPYYDLMKLTKIFIDKMKLRGAGRSNSLMGMQDILYNISNEQIRDKLWIELIKDYIDNSWSEKGILEITTDYLQFIEKSKIPTDYLKKAQNKMIEEILLRATSRDQKKNENDEEYEKIMAKYKQDSIDAFRDLLKKSQKLDKNYLWQKIKEVGPDYFAKIYYQDFGDKHPWERESKVAPDKLDVYNLSVWMKHKVETFSKSEFVGMLNRIDEEAKDYLRGFLWHDYEHNVYFILDAEMKPIDKDYKGMPFPGQFEIMKNWKQLKVLAAVWGPIFADFGIITNE